ncbi:MAG TPA: polysaccharide biosynthesis/export family protein [Candidatus Omnitrophota bacterium]|nr:polysaccharide biosynthesis/export family protein [Candidatus Omnitrophota bacterium]
MKRLICILLCGALFCFSAGMGSAEEKDANAGYVIGAGDILNVTVLQPEQLTLPVTVAPDGAISFPYIGTVMVKGRSLSAVQEEIQTRLSDGYMKYPVVSVSLTESRSKKFFVYGEIVKPGTYYIEENITVLKAISIAGGFTKFGSASKVKILRAKKDAPGYETMSINIKDVMDGNSTADIVIQPDDILVVSEGVF